MANEGHLELLRRMARLDDPRDDPWVVWNDWRDEHPNIVLDLSNVDFRRERLLRRGLGNVDLRGANLSKSNFAGLDLRGEGLSETDLREAVFTGADLHGAVLAEADLRGANLVRAKLAKANLAGADLTQADLTEADLSEATLRGAILLGANLRRVILCRTILEEADISEANLIGANLARAKLTGAALSGVTLDGATLDGADLTGVHIGWTVFGNVDLRTVQGLDTLEHYGPSTIGIDTLYRSQGNIPKVFLHGAGVPDEMITYIKLLVGRPFEFYYCFISYSSKDQEFAERLHADLQNKGVRCWFAPHDVQGGRKLHEQIDEAIRVCDRLLLILSPYSMNSEWVKTEIAKARQRQVQEHRQVLFPIRLVSFEAVRDWECFDADTGKDSAREIREYFIPDFSNWQDNDAYQKAFQQLLRDLKADT